MKPVDTIGYLKLFFLASLWGPSFMFIKLAVHGFTPIQMASIRIFIATIIFFILIKYVFKRPLPTKWIEWKAFLWMGVFANVIPFILFSWGEQFIDSALAGIINGSVPVFVAIIAHFTINTEKFSLQKLLGISMGFLGIIVLVSPDLMQVKTDKMLAIFAIAIACASYAIAAVYAKIKLGGYAPLVAPAAMHVASTMLMLPLFIWDRSVTPIVLDPMSVFAVCFLGVFGSVIAYIYYYDVMETYGVTFLSYSTYIIPLFGVLFGVLFLKESLHYTAYFAVLLILGGVFVMNAKKKV